MMRKEICFIFTAFFCFFLILFPASGPALAEDPEEETVVIEEIIPDIPSSDSDTGVLEPKDADALESTRVYTASSADLAAVYIDSVLPNKHPMLRASRPSGLIKFPEGSENRNLYQALQSRISDLANGTVFSSVFTIEAKDIFKYREFTAEELGVEALFYEKDDGTWAIYPDAAEAARLFFRNYIIDNFDTVYVCLLEDSPYEFYWLNTQIHPVLYEPDASFTKPANRTDVLYIRGTWTVAFPISREYAQTPENWDGSSILTDMKPSLHEWVANARANVDAILAGAPDGDYDKMKYYRDQIRSLSTYNGNAMGAEYGNPWQLIWVFDGDPDTKVVCEGFAKAFGYLCELDTHEAYSMLVRGWMQTPGMADPGAHMWNVVRIEGRSYLVDVTNDNSAYDLFLAGADDGTLSGGYTIRRGNSTILYTYNRITTSWDDSELTLSPLDYRVKCTGGSLHLEIPLEAGERQWIEFTPPDTGEYAFYTTGGADPYGEIYSPEGTLAHDDDDSGAGSNFFLHTELQAGVTYLFAVGIQTGGTAGCPTAHIVPYVPMTSITGGILELCPGEEGDIIPFLTPENATNIGISIETLNSGCATVTEDGHVTALQSGETAVRITSIENPELEDYTYILVHEPVTITADSRMTTENGQVRIHLHGEGSGNDAVNRFTMCFSESIDGTGRFEYAGCEYSGTAPYAVAVNSGTPYEGPDGIANRLTIRSTEAMYNDLPLNFDLTLIFSITDDSGLPEETLRLSITDFEIGCLSMTNKEKVLPYRKYVTIPVPLAFVLPGEVTPLTEADMVLPAGTILIEEEAFAGTGAERIRLPEGVMSIGTRAFADCLKLSGIYIPASCETIAEDAFAGTGGLVIYGETESAAQEYAEQRGIVFVPVTDNAPQD